MELVTCYNVYVPHCMLALSYEFALYFVFCIFASGLRVARLCMYVCVQKAAGISAKPADEAEDDAEHEHELEEEAAYLDQEQQASSSESECALTTEIPRAFYVARAFFRTKR